MKIKSNLKKLMDKESIKPSTLAGLIGASRPGIKDMYYDIADRYSKKNLELLCKYFNCIVSDILEIRK